jgi:hypothetical protein
MDDQSAKSTGELIAYIILGIAAFLNVIKYVYSAIKDLFKKNKGKDKNSDINSEVNINVNSTGLPNEDLSHFKENDRYFLYFLLEQAKILNALNNVKSDILSEQMEYFNKSIMNIKMEITKVIVDLLRDAKIEEDSYTTYFSNFENFIETCEGRLKDIFRNMCKDNGFSKYDSIQFKELINKNNAIILGTVAELLRKRYPQKDFIKNFNKIYQLKSSLKESLDDCFITARKIVIDKETKVVQAKECFEKQVSEIIGIKYSLEI